MKKAKFLPYDGDDTIERYSCDEGDDSDEQKTAAESASDAAIEELNNHAEQGKTTRVYLQSGTGKEGMMLICVYPADKYTIMDLIVIIQNERGAGDYRFMIYDERGKLTANKLIPIADPLGGKKGDTLGSYGYLDKLAERQEKMFRDAYRPQKTESRADFLAEMLQMKELFANNQPAAQSTDMMSQMKDMITVMAMLKDMAGGREDESDSFGGFFKSAVPLLQTLASNSRAKPEPKAKKPMINMLLENICVRVSSGSNPEAVANEILDTVPAIYHQQIADAITGDTVDVVNRFAELVSDVGNHKDSVREVVDYLKSELGMESTKTRETAAEGVTETVSGDTIDDNGNIIAPDS